MIINQDNSGNESIQIGINSGNLNIFQCKTCKFLPQSVLERLWREDTIQSIRNQLKSIGKSENWLKRFTRTHLNISFNELNDFMQPEKTLELYDLSVFVLSIIIPTRNQKIEICKKILISQGFNGTVNYENMKEKEINKLLRFLSQ